MVRKREGKGGDAVYGAWLPATAIVLLCLFSLSLWHLLNIRDRDLARTRLRAETDFLAASVEADIRNRLPALERVVRAWEIHGRMPKEEFFAEVGAYMADVPGFQAIEWADPGGVVRWIVPLEDNEKTAGMNLALEPNRRAAMAKARDSRSPSASAAVDLVQGGKGFLAFFPIYSRGELAGYLVAVLRFVDWLDYVLGNRIGGFEDGNYRAAAEFDGVPAYEQYGWEGIGVDVPSVETSIDLLDRRLILRVKPTKAFFSSNASPLPALVMAFGLLLSALTGLIIRISQVSARREAEAKTAGRALAAKIAEKESLELALKAAFDHADLATRAGGMGVWSWDLAKDKLEWNETMHELYDVPLDVRPEYSTWRNAIHREDIGAVEPLLRGAIEGKAVFDTEFRVLVHGGEIRHLRAAARVTRDPGGKAIAVTGINWDITEHRAAEESLRRSEARVRLLLNSTAEAIYGIDMSGNCIFANATCVKMLGYPGPEALLGRNMHDLIHHSYPDGKKMAVEECKIFRAFNEGKPSHVDDEVLWRADGSPFPAEYWSYPKIDGGEIDGAVVTFVDITERRKSEDIIRHLATHDALTDLPRMRLAEDRLIMAIKRAERDNRLVGVLFLDLDGFKGVNDTYGHDAGDAALKETALRLRSAIRESDTAARIGGDEFLVIAAAMRDADNASLIARKILAALSSPIAHGGAEFSVGASIGIALYPEDGDSAPALVKLADEAMYRAKNSGKNRYEFASADRAAPPRSAG
jgi:diguanylate cyclase (GGDEF)-like protein/PAS domain S-box-containing protein